MNTIEVCEHLLFKIPDLRISLFSLDIISESRNISSIEHEEFNNILLEFKNPVIISIVGIVHITFIIEPRKISRKYPIILINGYNCEKTFLSKTGLYSHISNFLNIKDFLPASIIKKIIFINNYKAVEGVIFSEYLKNIWTIDNPLLLPITNYKKTTLKTIIYHILDSLEN